MPAPLRFVFPRAVHLEWHPVELQLAHPWRISRTLAKAAASKDVARSVVVRLHGPDGLCGLGEAAPSPRYQESIDTVSAFLAGVDVRQLLPEDIPGSMARVEALAPGNTAAKCALNLALLDLAARRAGAPLHTFLGLPFEEDRHITSFSIGIDTPDMIRRKVEAARGYPVLKLKLGSPHDEANLAALRSVAPTVPLRVDANEAWTSPDEALRRIETLARDPHIEFVEQPLPAAAPDRDLAWLKARSPLPLFADESCRTAGDIARCAEGFHGVNVKLVKTSGVSGAHAALVAARKAGLKTMIGCMVETSILISAAAHLAHLADYLDIDGSLLVTNDPFEGVSTVGGRVSFRHAVQTTGLRVQPRVAV